MDVLLRTALSFYGQKPVRASLQIFGRKGDRSHRPMESAPMKFVVVDRVV